LAPGEDDHLVELGKTHGKIRDPVSVEVAPLGDRRALPVRVVHAEHPAIAPGVELDAVLVTRIGHELGASDREVGDAVTVDISRQRDRIPEAFEGAAWTLVEKGPQPCTTPAREDIDGAIVPTRSQEVVDAVAVDIACACQSPAESSFLPFG
jgi:hypothetical protein